MVLLSAILTTWNVKAILLPILIYILIIAFDALHRQIDRLAGTMYSEKAQFQKAFSILKPACDAFITEPNDVNTNLLNTALSTIPKYTLTHLQPYVLIPLEIHLKANKCVWLCYVICFNTMITQKCCFLDQIVLKTCWTCWLLCWKKQLLVYGLHLCEYIKCW
jgi:hypothetical protein